MKVYPAMVIKTINTFITTSTVFAELEYLQFKDFIVNNRDSQRKFFKAVIGSMWPTTGDTLQGDKLAELFGDNTVLHVLSAFNH
jgi:hypothetical protein